MKYVRPHDPLWKDKFATEAQLLRTALESAALEIHHIGSTAIPDLWAKPIIDIAVAARALQAVDARGAEMEAIGYEARGEHGVEGRRYFKKAVAPGEGFHVHVFARGSEQIASHLRFRDFLRLRPDLAQDYSTLKRSLADAHGALVEDYAARKAAFVRHVQDLARLHFG